MPQQTHDVVIVGAGSCGAVLAARLSEGGQRSVLLLEAGALYANPEDFPPELLQAGVLSASMPGHEANWTFMAALTPDLTFPVTRGKVVGGSSALNGTYFIRGTQPDFDGWAKAGNDEWSFDRVLPYFKRLERDFDFTDDFHGSEGPIPVRRQSGPEFSASAEAFLSACQDHGFPDDPDKNAPDTQGAGPLPLNAIDGVRVNTAIAYLLPALWRPNLTVQGDALVRRVIFDGRRAVGVEVERGGRTEIVTAGEVVLATGAVKSPHLLMLSGVGPATELIAQGIDVVHDSPGVGKGFSDHPDLVVGYQADIPAEHEPSMALFQVALNYTAEGSDLSGDMEIVASSFSFATAMSGEISRTGLTAAASTLKRPMKTFRAMRGTSIKRLVTQARRQTDLVLACNLQQPVSSGELRLVSADPMVNPALDYHYLEDQQDLRRMREAIRLAAELLRTKPFQDIGAKRMAPGDDVINADPALDEWMRENLATAIHMSCSCRMGPESDPSAVVDQYGAVHGVEGLRVIDTSIMPAIVRRGPHATAIMMAERAAVFFA